MNKLNPIQFIRPASAMLLACGVKGEMMGSVDPCPEYRRLSMFLPLVLALAVTCFPGAVACVATESDGKRPNILFLAVDDLRPEIDSYGARQMVTPHFDRLAGRGVRFDRAYCNIAVCGASRASLMKGLRPTPSRFTKYHTRADEDAPQVPSLPMVFKQHGYHTQSNGKVYHHVTDDPQAWSEPS